jgi:hypothetical protein
LQNRVDARFCIQCGDALQTFAGASASVASPDAQVRTRDPSQTPARGEMWHPYKRLGGWLLFLVVVDILSAILAFFSMAGVISAIRLARAHMSAGAYEALSSVAVIAYGFSIAVGIIFVLMILRRDKRFFFFYHIGAALTFVLMVVVGGCTDAAGSLPFLTFTTVADIAIRTLYFCRSVRVRTYMETDAYIKDNPFTKRVTPPASADGVV